MIGVENWGKFRTFSFRAKPGTEALSYFWLGDAWPLQSDRERFSVKKSSARNHKTSGL